MYSKECWVPKVTTDRRKTVDPDFILIFIVIQNESTGRIGNTVRIKHMYERTCCAMYVHYCGFKIT